MAKTAEPAPQTVFAELRLTCDVQPDVVIEPATPTFTAGRPGTVTLALKPGAVADVKVKQAYSSTKTLRVTVDAAANTVTIEYDPTTAPNDDNPPTLMIETTSTTEQWIRIPVIVTPSEKEPK